MRDPVEVAADAALDNGLCGDSRQDMIDAIAAALRTEAARAGEAMREAAAEYCDNQMEGEKSLSDVATYVGDKDDAALHSIAANAFREAAARIRALPLSDAPASPWPKVKPLVWKGPSFPAMPTYHARSVLGRYAYWRQGDRWKAVCPDGVDVDAPSEESARAVCQGHFQAGILSALDLFTPPAKDEQA